MKLVIGLMMLFISSIAYSQDDTIPPPNDVTEVKVVNESLNVIVQDTIDTVQLIGPMFTPSQFRSFYGKVDVPPKSKQTGLVQFNELVVVYEVSFATSPSSAPSPPCDRIVVRISINNLIANVSLASVGLWKPPVGMVLEPGQYLKYVLENKQVTAYDFDANANGPKAEPCVTEFVVLAVTPPKKVDTGI
jgi:hypothetical protein